jgi:hypothetical protein
MVAPNKVDLFRPAVEGDSLPVGTDARPIATNGSPAEDSGAARQREKVFARLLLPANVELVAQRWTAEGWSGSFTYFGQEEFILRERRKGNIECEYRPYNRVKRELGEPKRRRTGAKTIDGASTPRSASSFTRSTRSAWCQAP